MEVMRQRFGFGLMDDEEEEGFAMTFPNARAIYCHTFLSLQTWPFKWLFPFQIHGDFFFLFF